jgi:hypothetical protein
MPDNVDPDFLSVVILQKEWDPEPPHPGYAPLGTGNGTPIRLVLRGPAGFVANVGMMVKRRGDMSHVGNARLALRQDHPEDEYFHSFEVLPTDTKPGTPSDYTWREGLVQYFSQKIDGKYHGPEGTRDLGDPELSVVTVFLQSAGE